MPAGAAQTGDDRRAFRLGEDGPEGRARLLPAEGVEELRRAEGIFEQWAAKSPEDAAAQAKAIADPLLREHAISGAVNVWLSGDDVPAVEQWVINSRRAARRTSPPPPWWDALSFTDPQPAWDRAMGIKDAQVRQEAMLAAFAALVQTDREAAKTALNSTSVSEQDRKLLQPVLNSSPKLPQPQ